MLLASRRAMLTMGVVALCAGAIASAFAADSKRPITKLTYDPSLPQVELFDGLDSGTLTAKVIPQSQFGGKVLITNTTKTPVSVKLPDSVVGVQVFPQIGGGLGGGGLGGGGLGGGGLGGGGLGGQGGGQSVGGGLGGGGGGGLGGGGLGGGGGLSGGGGGGAGFFSIPAERTVSVPMNTVCLEHGKANPNAKMTYRLARPSEVSDKPELAELLKLVGTNKIEKGAAQAAAWHIASGMTWEQIAAEKWDHVGQPDSPYFTPDQIMAGRMAVSDVQAKAREKAKENKDEPKTEGVRSAVSAK